MNHAENYHLFNVITIANHRACLACQLYT